MTLKTVPSLTQADYPAPIVELYYKHPWDASWTRIQGEISGSLRYGVNSSPSLELEYMSPRGSNTHYFKPFGLLKLKLGFGVLDSDLSTFIGYITPGAGIKRHANSVTLSAVGYSGLMQRELMLPDLSGDEAGAAIRDIGLSLSLPMNVDGVRSSQPERVVGTHFEIEHRWQTKFSVLAQLIEGMCNKDTSDPRIWYWYEEPIRGSDTPGLVVRYPRPDLLTRTVTWDDEIITSSDTSKTEQYTSCVAASSDDPDVYQVYEQKSTKETYCLSQKLLTMDTKNEDELLKAAYREVVTQHLPTRSATMSVFDALSYRPLEAVVFDGGPYGFSDTQLVMEVKASFGSVPSLGEVVLSSLDEEITDFL